MIITISGQVGAGKSTLGKKLAERFFLEYISAGRIMREMAREHEMNLLEFSKFAELNSWIDKEIDEKQKQAAEKSHNCLVEGRISAHFLPADLKLFLIAPLETRAQRVMDRDKIGNIDEAKKGIEEREGSERKRYQRIYHIDLDKLDEYDLILNTEKFSAKEMETIIAGVIEKVIGK